MAQTQLPAVWKKTNTAAKRVREDEDDSQPTKSWKRSRTGKTELSQAQNEQVKQKQKPHPKSTRRLVITEEIGDLFTAPQDTVLVHSCNCEGHWGAGIAKAFKDRYPSAFNKYHDHCSERSPQSWQAPLCS